ncbi:uncharacterized protein LOC126817677 [Patella vulgata]|uniref:uncharacterized protein LOC126817677 n=1 Tax=Patella vulgata TaxID=6465 RepID=UPI00217FAEE8|nr:uncharacterized protein LOC126817677 [Patella vulgata]
MAPIVLVYRKKRLIRVILCSCTCLVLCNVLNYLANHWSSSSDSHIAIKSAISPRENNICPDVLNGMVYGRWKHDLMTPEQTNEMRIFLESARIQHGLPKSLQRNDSKCGYATFDKSISPTIVYFRALCDPYGPKPCCFNNECVDKTTPECRCKNCFDMRQPHHAEYSEWIPYDQRCQLKKFNYNEVCDLLNDATLYLSGDSYIRHIYTELLLFLRNNTYDGALKRTVSKDIHDKCTGMYMFTEMACRENLDFSTEDLCGGKLELKYEKHMSADSGPEFASRVETLMNKPRSLVLFGLAIHSFFKFSNIRDNYILPALNRVQNKTWPKFLWATPHCPGILKNGNIQAQAKPNVLKFMKEAADFLSPLKIPIFNSYNMTEGMMSFDGNHYGHGMNYWKIQIIFNYIQELKDTGNW